MSVSPKSEDEVAVTIRFPRDVHERAKRLADLDYRSFNLWMVLAARREVERGEKERGLAAAEPVSKKRGGGK